MSPVFAYLWYLVLNSTTIMQKSKTETLIQKYLSHQLNEQEFKELKQWIEEDASHKEIFVKLLSLRHVNNQLNLLQQFDKEASWEAIQNVASSPTLSAIGLRFIHLPLR